MDICGYKSCLVADCDGIYDPSTPNGRLLLGLKGQLSEMELHTIRSRLTAGLLNKAKRGDLALQLPIGLIRDESQKVQKDPNLEVQQRIELIFHTFLQLKSASKVLRSFNDRGLLIPRRDRLGDLVWKKRDGSQTPQNIFTILGMAHFRFQTALHFFGGEFRHPVAPKVLRTRVLENKTLHP